MISLQQMKIILEQVILKNPDNYFIFLQLDEISGETRLQSQKAFSDLVANCARPYFLRNSFKFDIKTLQSDFKLKLGLFRSDLTECLDLQTLMAKSQKLTNVTFKLGKKQKTRILDKENLTGKVKLSEYGSLGFNIKFQGLKISDLIKADNQALSQYFYDPQVQNQSQIQKRKLKVQQRLLSKQEQIFKNAQKLSRLREVLISIKSQQISARNRIQLNQRVKAEWTAKNKQINQQSQLQTICQLLGQTQSGRERLKQKLSKLLYQIQFEKQLNLQLQEKLGQRKPFIDRKLNNLKEFCKLQQLLQEQQFQISRLKSSSKDYQLLLQQLRTTQSFINTLKEKLKSQNELVEIKHLKAQLQILQIQKLVNKNYKYQQPVRSQSQERQIQQAKKYNERLLVEIQEISCKRMVNSVDLQFKKIKLQALKQQIQRLREDSLNQFKRIKAN